MRLAVEELISDTAFPQPVATSASYLIKLVPLHSEESAAITSSMLISKCKRCHGGRITAHEVEAVDTIQASHWDIISCLEK